MKKIVVSILKVTVMIIVTAAFCVGSAYNTGISINVDTVSHKDDVPVDYETETYVSETQPEKDCSQPDTQIIESEEKNSSVSTTPSKSSSIVTVKENKVPETQIVEKVPEIRVIAGNTSEKIRAVWITYYELNDILKGKSEAQFTKNVKEMFNQCCKGGFNTVIVHVRSNGDAFYNSKYFPTSIYFTGTRKDNAPYDPLKIMVKEAHARGLRLEAWINPFRGPKASNKLSENDIFKRWADTGKVYKYGSPEYYYFNPANDEVYDYIIKGVNEIVTNYDVDGIHFDDYFYTAQDEWIDRAEYEKLGNGRTLSQFRLDRISELVSRTYKAIKSKKNITFGISPSGNIESCYSNSYADVKLWAGNEGYVDYIAPQIYWTFNDGKLPFDKALKDWENVVVSPSVRMIVGLAAYKVNNADYAARGVWNSGIDLCDQIVLARKCEKYDGYIMFSYSKYFDDICKIERENVYKIIND